MTSLHARVFAAKERDPTCEVQRCVLKVNAVSDGLDAAREPSGAGGTVAAVEVVGPEFMVRNPVARDTRKYIDLGSAPGPGYSPFHPAGLAERQMIT